MSQDIQLNNWLGNRLFGSFKKITIGNTYIWINTHTRTQRERERERERGREREKERSLYYSP